MNVENHRIMWTFGATYLSVTPPKKTHVDTFKENTAALMVLTSCFCLLKCVCVCVVCAAVLSDYDSADPEENASHSEVKSRRKRPAQVLTTRGSL